MLKSFLITSLVGVASIVATFPAHALSSYSFSFSSFTGNPIGLIKNTGSVIGVFTTDDLPNGATAATSVLIQGISGTITDSTNAGGAAQSITALLAPGGFRSNDNLLFPLAAEPNKLNKNGVAFTAGGLSYLLNFSPRSGFYELFNPTQLLASSSRTINLTPVAAVPFEFSPALGIGVLGGLFAAKKLSRRFSKK